VLAKLKGERKGSVVRFLYESSLITRDRPILYLSGANLIGAYLGETKLTRTNLQCLSH
jgi:uncharacterized protein YjbI with pentapeptide repeats